MASDPDEVGSAHPLRIFFSPELNDATFRLRIGTAYFITAIALLTGTPIDGALLGPDNQWYKPIVFSGVRLST